MKNIILKLSIIAIICLNLSCSKDSKLKVSSINYAKLLEINNFYLNGFNGYVAIQSKKIIGDRNTDTKNTINTASAYFWDSNNAPTNSNTLKLDDIVLSPSENENFRYKIVGETGRNHTRQLYGRKVNIEIADNNVALRNETELYCPQEIEVYQPIRPSGRNSKINRQAVIQWNADPNNEMGVVIAVSYISKLDENAVFLNSLSKDIGTLTEDDGEHTITIDSTIPAGSIVTVYIARGNAEGIETGNLNTLATCYTVAFSDYRVE